VILGLVAPADHRVCALDSRVCVPNNVFCAVSFLKYEIHGPLLKIDFSGSQPYILLGLDVIQTVA
jgi:hypothetical protein